MTAREPAIGETLGEHYVIERLLGRGGFGVVYQARHIALNRLVAVKVILATSAGARPDALDRFRREATIAASLEYPNTIRIFDFGATPDGLFYLVMELIRGRDLAAIIAETGPLPPERALHIIRQVLFALGEAHARGIVHRDIKPENVMICPLSYDPDFVKVMDFGIAKMTDGDDQLTQRGITLGTPRYMPAEQFQGGPLTPATDLYAVGLVLYELLVGRPFFNAPTVVDTALLVVRGDPVSVPPDVPLAAPLRALIERASARDPAARFPSTRAFLTALDALPAQLARSQSPTISSDYKDLPTPQTFTTRSPTTPPRARPDDEALLATQAISQADLLAASPPPSVSRRAETTILPATPSSAAPPPTAAPAPLGSSPAPDHASPPGPAALPLSPAPLPANTRLLLPLNLAILCGVVLLVILRLVD